MSIRKRYCKIENCENSQGFDDSTIRLICVPSSGEYRQQWIDAIEVHQPFDTQCLRFLICERHFEGLSNTLTKNPKILPTIFPRSETRHVNNQALDKYPNATQENESIASPSDPIGETKEKDLESLCLQLQMQLSKVTAENYDLKQKLKESSHRMRNISQQVRDVKSAKKKLEELVSSLRNDEYISEQAAEVLKTHNAKEIIECLLNGSGSQYKESVRAFALTLHFYSPRAYNYVREKFDNHLPHTTTIRKWYMNNNGNGDPGFCRESFVTLKNLADQAENQIMCTLVFDEMHIRKHLQWCDNRKEFLGSINYGFPAGDTENLHIAKNALVFMLVGINVSFTMPIAYYFINDLKAEEKANLLKEIFVAVNDCNVRVLCVTFDGLSSNIKMCTTLGASFDRKKFQPAFVSPGDGKTVYIILDPSHMEKLARNCIASSKVMLDADGNKIEWKFFERLEELRVNKSLELTHKLNKKHMQWDKAKMSVRLAVETLSKSVADSMEFLMKNGFEEFEGAAGTIRFIRCMDQMFDIMNTKRINSQNVFKSALNADNSEIVFEFFNGVIPYLSGLTMEDGQSILSSKKRTAFRGFIINMNNLISIYSECIATKILPCLPTFRLSQDHLESFFGRIRSLGGYNDNPTVEQFCSAFRKVVINNEIMCTNLSNCKDSLNILFISSRRPKSTAIENEQISKKSELDEYVHFVDEAKHLNNIDVSDYLLDDLEQTSTAYIAGAIEKKIENCWRFHCVDCLRVFYDDDKIVGSMKTDKTRPPSFSTFKMCTAANKFVKVFCKDPKYSYDQVLNDILRSIDHDKIFPKSDFSTHEEHKYYLIKFIVEEFLRIKCNYLAQKYTLKEHGLMLRKKLKKTIHQVGQ